MAEKNRRADPLADEPLPFSSLQQIGKELLIEFAEIVIEPLPAETIC